LLTLQPHKLPITEGDKILDLGCGEGRHALGLQYLWQQQQLTLVGLDISIQDLGTAYNRLQVNDSADTLAAKLTFIRGDGLQLPFADNSFDHVICSEVLEHIIDYQAMLAEISRVLKPGGSLCVSVPRAWPEKICWWLESAYHQVEGGHVRIFNGQQLTRDITQRGYCLHAKHWSHSLHVPYWWLRCLFWRRGDHFFPVRTYHKLLVWDLFTKPWLTQTLDALLNPIMGKSLVLYFRKNI